MLNETHRSWLLNHAVSEFVADACRAYSIEVREDLPEEMRWAFDKGGPGCVIPWTVPDRDRSVPQFAPSNRWTNDEGRQVKYVFPKGSGSFVGRWREPSGSASPILVVEGTKQSLAAWSWAPADWGIYGVPGCANWNGSDLGWADGRKVVVLFDADLDSNRNVYDAADGFRKSLLALGGAESVKFAELLNAKSKDGLDDVLAKLAPEKRQRYLTGIVSVATDKLGRPPAKAKGSVYFDKDGGLLAETTSRAVLNGLPAAIAKGSTVALYRDGVYVLHEGREPLFAAVQGLLGENYRPTWRATVEESILGMLSAEGAVLPERMHEPLLNVKNGMLDLRTGQLQEHSPAFMSRTQVPIEWDPDAKAPRYEAWVNECCPGQVMDLEETVSMMLDPSLTPPKAAFLFGPSRSGKSTYLRIVSAIAGGRNVSGVSLHSLSEDPFASANLYGKMVNVCADLSSAHLTDTSLFKQLTGADTVHANRKYGHQFEFTNTALFAFSANRIPTVNETSSAYLERIKPFSFPHSFAGRENPDLEDALMDELPGILVRLVDAWRRRKDRGGYLPTDADTRRAFETGSDRVRMWFERLVVVHPDAVGKLVGPDKGSGKAELYSQFKVWVEAEGGKAPMRRSDFLDRLSALPDVGECRLLHKNKNLGLNVTVVDEGEKDIWVTPSASHTAFRTPAPHTPEPAGQELDHESGGVGVWDNSFKTSASLSEIHSSTELTVGTTALKGTESHRHTSHTEGAVTSSDAGVSTDGGVSTPSHTGPRVPLDLETGSADSLYTGEPGPGYIRLTGVGDTAHGAVEAGTAYVTHQGHYFDLPALDRHAGIPVEQTIPLSRDLRVAAFQHDPPTTYETTTGPGFKSYSLNALGERYLGVPKSEAGKALAKEYGGWDNIPADDPRYAEYCVEDLDLTRRLDEVIPYDPYEKREAAVSAVTARATLSGMRVDVAGLQERAQSLAAQADEGRTMLADTYGFPTTNKAGKPASAPQRTAEGKAAFEAALSDLGYPVAYWPRGADGSLSLGKDVMAKAAEWAREKAHPALSVIEAVQTMNGIRNNAANVLRWVGTDGRVHPLFLPFQSTGRWSVQDPGLTVLKKGVADSERAFLLPDEGDVLVSIDLDQVDIRCVAAHSQDANLIAILNDPERDIHQEVADLAGVARKEAKTLDLGWLYGRTVNGLAKTPGVDLDTAARVDGSMREQFAQVMRWQQEVRDKGEAGVLLDNGFGRRLRVDPARAFTQSPALMGQSTTRDLIAEGLLDLKRTAPEVLPMLRIIVHDEMVASVPREHAEEVARVIQSACSREWAPAGASRPVSITAGQGKPFVFGETWADLYL